MQNAVLDESQTGIKFSGGNINNLRYADDATLFFLIWNASRICILSLHRGHANLLCIVPILVYVLPKRARCHSYGRNRRRTKEPLDEGERRVKKLD